MISLLHWKFFYLSLLVFSLGGMALWDWRYHLLFFDKPKAALKTIVGLLTLLLIGDLIGINWNIFSTSADYVSGLYLGSPNLPVEELLFLTLLSYITLNMYVWLKRRQHV